MTIKVRFFESGAFDAWDLRAMFGVLTASEGVLRMSHLKVTQKAGTANNSVDVSGGFAIIQGDLGTTELPQYPYQLESTANTNITIPANGSGSQRNDIIVARIYDTIYDSLGLEVGTIEKIAGVAGAGDPNIPPNTIQLARIKVPAGYTNGQILTATHIDDLRQRWLPADYMSTGYVNGYVENSQRGPVTTTETQLATFRATLLANRRYKFCVSGFIGGTAANDRAFIRIRDNDVSGTERVVGGASVFTTGTAIPMGTGMRNWSGIAPGTYTYSVTLGRGFGGTGSVYANYGGSNNIEAWIEDMGDVG